MAKDGTPKKSKKDASTRQQRLPLSWDDADEASALGESELVEAAVEPDETPPTAVHAEVPAGKSPDVAAEEQAALVAPPQSVGPEPVAGEMPDAPAQRAGKAASKQDRIKAREAASEAADADAPASEADRDGGSSAVPAVSDDRAATAGVSEERGPISSPVAFMDDDKTASRSESPSVSASDSSLPDNVKAGEMLLGARADFGFSVEDVATKTRIPRDVIDNLECSAIELLPSEYYCQTHIERLCALYNVDPEAILERFSAEMRAVRGTPPQTDRFHMARHESESGAMIRPVPEGSGSHPGRDRRFSLTGILVSSVIALFVVAAVWALVALELRNRNRGEEPPEASSSELLPPVELNEFVVPMQLDAYELPIPDHAPASRD